MGDMRLSDAERQDALDVLEEHVRTGRLDIDEYGARSAKVTAAKRVSELVPLFDDLPSPRPSALLNGVSAPRVPVASSEDSALVRFLTAAAVPIAIVLAVAVLILSRGRLLIISVALPLVVAMIAGARRRR
ncbi:DUF1707 domain-containing protein [Amycolatopsis sp. NPDC051102]|uniref:DUF1707 SHOCT-like domain-containing protein n=1 Tax=Amycolatopsis sp. NPDC051102 TaxID=3155163 RepID=UPI00341C0766